MRWPITLGLALAGLIPSPVQASCSGAAFGTCASVTVTTRYDPRAGVTLVDFIVRNLGRPGAALIAAMYVSNVSVEKQLRGNDPAGPNGSSGATYTTDGRVGHAPDCDPRDARTCDPLDDAWDTWCDPSANPVCWTDKYDMFPTILGCTVEDPLQTLYPHYGAIQTCDGLGYTGSAVFSFSLAGKWKKRDLALHMEASEGVVCGVEPTELGMDLPPCPAALTTVPEPTTWALLATGLVGLGAGAWWRGRRSGRR